MNEYQKDTQELIAAIQAYMKKYGGGYDSSQHAKLLVDDLKADLEENQ